MARTFTTRFLPPLRGLTGFGNADPQLKLRAIVCRLCEADKFQRRRRGIFVVWPSVKIISSVRSDIGSPERWRVFRRPSNNAPRLGVRWQSGSGDTAFGRTKRVENSIRDGHAKAAWRRASRRSPRHAGANFENPTAPGAPGRRRGWGGFFLIKLLAGAKSNL